MKKKYKLIPSYIKGLFRIKALCDFGDVKKGDIGGYVSGELNLSHEGNCWIYGNAKVYDNAAVFGNAKVCGYAEVYGYARVHGYAEVHGTAQVRDNAEVYGYARVYGYAAVFGNAKVCGYAEVYGYARVHGYAEVYGNAKICGDAVIIKGMGDYMVFQNTWSSGRYFTWTRSNNMWKVGCFYGSGDELIEKAYKDSELKGRQYKTIVNCVNEMLKNEKDLEESE